MSVGGHGRQTTAKGIHTPFAWTFADSSARTGFTPTEGEPMLQAQLTADDIGRVGLQLDDNSMWRLTATTPTWTQLGGTPGGLDHSSLTGVTANQHHNQVHALGGGDHTSATLAQLNALVSDATLDDSGGPRTDPDAIHDNVAGEITAITEKATPVAADVVVIEDSEDSNNKKRVQIGNIVSSGFRKVYGPYDFLSPFFDFAVNAGAGLGADTANPSLLVRRFDDTTEEGVGFGLTIPSGSSDITLYFKSRAQSTPGGTVGVQPLLYTRIVGDNTAVSSWSAATQLTPLSLPSNTNWQYDNETLTLSSLSLSADTYVQFEITRDGADGDDSLVGDWTLLELVVEFS